MCERLADERSARESATVQLRHAERLTTDGKLASGLAHELGTPLNVVSGRARLIQEREVEGADVVDSAKIVVEQADRMTALIKQLLDFARPRALQKAPVLDPYTGPALLEPEAAGVLFHEAVGHRLEGERQNDDKDGRTFKGQVDKPILPFFISVIDDPTQRAAGPVSLNGYYRFDDQGVPGQKTVLVEKGVLRTFLMSRAPVQGVPSQSNGHGRSAPGRDPVARMSNLIVESSKALPSEKLKEALIAEARRQERPFGLLIHDVTDVSASPERA